MKIFGARVILFLLLWTVSQHLLAQVSSYVREVHTSRAREGEPVSLSIHTVQNVQIQNMSIFVRRFGESEFKEIPMLLSGRVAVATVPSSYVVPPYLEYYVSLRTTSGQVLYPEENPQGNPLKITVEAVDPKENEVRVLSPEPGETVAAQELAVAISLLYASDAVEKKQTRLYLDGVDVTSEVIFADDILLFNPLATGRQLDLGTHTLSIQLYDTTGNLYVTKTSTFNLSTTAVIEAEERKLRINGSAQLEARNEQIDAQSTTYLRGDVQVDGSYRIMTGGVNLHITNEDKPTLQPQNRYLGFLQIGEYAKLQIGDAYPAFPSLYISGKRVRGITGSLTLGFFNVDVTWGQTERRIEGTVVGDTTYSDSSAAASRPTESLPLGGLSYRLFESGTYARNLFAIRPSFGSGENFQIGFTVLKSKDDVGSIRYGVYPKENLVAGTDFLVAFDDQRIKWTTQIALSLSNTDIRSGDLSDAAIDSIKGVYDPAKTPEERANAQKEADDLKRLASVGRSFITINEFLTPLNPIDHLPSTAIESELLLNYFNNFVRVLGFRRGKAYSSFGNEFIQTDVEGINISDRIRFFENRMLLSLAYEIKANNTAHDAATPTTHFNTLTTSLTVFPGSQLPSFTVGYGFYTRKSSVDISSYSLTGKSVLQESSLPADTILAASYRMLYAVIPDDKMINAADERTNRYYIGINYDFSFMGKQSLTFLTTIAAKDDRTFYRRNQDNLNISLQLTTRYTIPLQTTLGIIHSSNATYMAERDSIGGYLTTTTKTLFDYQTLSLGARYRLLDDKLNVIGMVAPSFGAFRRLLLQVGAEYEAWENHYFTAELSFLQYPGKPTDVLAGIIYRLAF